MKLAVQTEGEGPAVLLVHGFPDSGRLWRNQTGPLVDAGYRVIVPDLRGFGSSPRPEAVEDYRLTTVVGDLVELLDEPAHVVGHDWGAALAWALALMRPDLVRSLAALSVGHPNANRPPTIEQREKSWYMLLFQFEEAEELLMRHDAALLREWLADPVDLERYLEDLSRPGALTAGLNFYRANLHPRRALEWQPAPPCTVPTLGIWSSGDRYLTEGQMRRSGEHVTASWRYERIEDAGHWLQLDAPERVTELLLEHLSAR